jgi:hypothetical protein
LDANSGADGWALTPGGTRGVLSDAVSIYFADATLTSEFIALVRQLQERDGRRGIQVREDEPAPRDGTTHAIET